MSLQQSYVYLLIIFYLSFIVAVLSGIAIIYYICYYHYSSSTINLLTFELEQKIPALCELVVPRLAGNDPTEIEPLQAEDSTANILGVDLPVGTGKTSDPRTGNM